MKLKKFFKFLGIISCLMVLALYFLFSYFTQPKSDKKILEKFEEVGVNIELKNEQFQDFNYRKLQLKNNDSLPTIVFVHGAIGSCIDFFEYMTDDDLKSRANFISYDRVGYNYKDDNNVQESIAFERKMLQNITKYLDKKNAILVGYSYGGPIVLADFNPYKKVILLAPAVYSKVEPMPWMINFYNWKLTRCLVPDIWKQASKEKLTHREDLKKFENNWKNNPNSIISIHGDDDSIVPYENSKYLESQFSKDQFELITIPDAGHSLVWSEFGFVKQQILKQLD